MGAGGNTAFRYLEGIIAAGARIKAKKKKKDGWSIYLLLPLFLLDDTAASCLTEAGKEIGSVRSLHGG